MFQALKNIFTKNNEGEYLRLFNRAVDRSNKYDLGKFEKLKNTEVKLISDERFQLFCASLAALNITHEDLVAQCMSIHLQLKPYVDKFFDTESVLTIGHLINENGYKTFHETLESRVNALTYGYDVTKPLKIHVWLTLPTCEILDFTYYSTLAEKFKIKDLEGAMVVVDPRDKLGFPRYVPEFIGDKFLEATGILRNYTVKL